jgi:transposase
LRSANRELELTNQKLDELCAVVSTTASGAENNRLSDGAILRSLPGIGRITLVILLSEASGPISRRDYPALRTLSGVAPVTKRRGKSHIVVMRSAAHERLRNAGFHWARSAVQADPKSRIRYTALRERGHSYGRALRGVADRLLGVARALLRHQTTFDPKLSTIHFALSGETAP